MDEQPQTGKDVLFTLDVFIRWLDAEPPQGKVRQVLTAFVDKARIAIERGEEPPAASVNQLFAWHRDLFGGPQPTDLVTGKWLPASLVRTWWEGQGNSRRQFLQKEGAPQDIVLIIDQGGGRGNATTYRFAFPAPPVDEEHVSESVQVSPSPNAPASPDVITYEVESANCSFIWRPILGKPFPMKSARGALFVALIALPFAGAVICALWSVVWLIVSPGTYLAHAGPFLAATMVCSFFTHALKPFWDLPPLRVTIAPDWILGWDQIYGQFRLARDSGRETGGRFSLVRYYGTCPVCAGIIEIRSGGTAFPRRLIGCCSDNPREHIFSFDAVTLQGRALFM